MCIRDSKAAGAVVRLLDVYGVLTLLPGQTKDYSKQEFARDLYLLDQSGLTALVGAGRRLRWAASTGTRQPGVLTTVARSGQQQRYWGIAFEEGAVTDLLGSGLPLGGAGLTTEQYVDFVAKEYLGDYVRSGGAAVR